MLKSSALRPATYRPCRSLTTTGTLTRLVSILIVLSCLTSCARASTTKTEKLSRRNRAIAILIRDFPRKSTAKKRRKRRKNKRIEESLRALRFFAVDFHSLRESQPAETRNFAPLPFITMPPSRLCFAVLLPSAVIAAILVMRVPLNRAIGKLRWIGAASALH